MVLRSHHTSVYFLNPCLMAQGATRGAWTCSQWWNICSSVMSERRLRKMRMWSDSPFGGLDMADEWAGRGGWSKRIGVVQEFLSLSFQFRFPVSDFRFPIRGRYFRLPTRVAEVDDDTIIFKWLASDNACVQPCREARIVLIIHQYDVTSASHHVRELLGTN